MARSASSSSSSGKRTPAADATALLTKDHATVRKLLRELEKTTTRARARRESLLETLALEVDVHAQIEEEIFYPAFREATRRSEDERKFLEAAEEHGLVHSVLPALKKTDAATELFSARAKVLKDLIEHHAEEEEDELFPRSRKLLDRATLRDLGERMQRRKLELMSGGATRPRNGAGSRPGVSRTRARGAA